MAAQICCSQPAGPHPAQPLSPSLHLYSAPPPFSLSLHEARASVTHTQASTEHPQVLPHPCAHPPTAFTHTAFLVVLCLPQATNIISCSAGVHQVSFLSHPAVTSTVGHTLPGSGNRQKPPQGWDSVGGGCQRSWPSPTLVNAQSEANTVCHCCTPLLHCSPTPPQNPPSCE